MGGIRAPRRRARLHASQDKGGGHRERAGRPHLGDPYGRDDWDGHLEPNVGDHGLFHCGCGWKSSVPDIGEWRRHMADAILAELAEVRERG